jgi:hypothetical protein
MALLEEQKFEGPNPLSPINIDDVESEIIKIGIDDVATGTGVGAGISAGIGGSIGVSIGGGIGGG